jgi:hypothetical protein
MTVFLDLRAAVVALLLVDPPVADGQVFTQRKTAHVREQGQAVNVRIVRSQAMRAGVGGGPTDWTTVIGVEMFYRAAAGDEEPTDGLDPLIEAVFERLAGAELPDLGVEDVLPDPLLEWEEEEEAASPVAQATFLLQIVHRTPGSALTPWP